MEQLVVLLNNPVILVILLLIVLFLMSVIRKGGITSIGKDGIKFSEHDNKKLDMLTEKINKLDMLTEKIDKLAADTKDNKKALLRLQIISDATDLKTKLMLFDEYKALGGNSYIDLYIEQLKKKEVSDEKGS